MQWNLRIKRTEAGETQKDLAELLGISENTYANKEMGKAKFNSEEMFILAKHYNAKLDELFLPIKYTKRKQKSL